MFSETVGPRTILVLEELGAYWGQVLTAEELVVKLSNLPQCVRVALSYPVAMGQPVTPTLLEDVMDLATGKT